MEKKKKKEGLTDAIVLFLHTRGTIVKTIMDYTSESLSQVYQHSDISVNSWDIRASIVLIMVYGNGQYKILIN